MTAIITLSPLYCSCGMQLITVRQVREGRCEYCAVAGVNERRTTVEEVRKMLEVRG
jgi:hypothetical protein